MKITAIVYNSNAGHTARYASLLSENTGIPCYSMETAKLKVEKGEKVLYLGWLMAGIVKGYKKAAKHYDVVMTLGVGMTPPTDKERARLAKQNGIDISKFDMLLGGFDIKKLSGGYKFMMGCMAKFIKKGIAEKPDATADEKLMLDMAVNGGDYVSVENLAPIINKISK